MRSMIVLLAAVWLVPFPAAPARESGAPQRQAHETPDGGEAAFRVSHFSARLEAAPVVVLERPAYLRYLAPYFVANATVECTVPRGQKYAIGFIQQVDSMTLRNEYARATTSWELSRFPMYDHATVASPPWYCTLHEVQEVEGGSGVRRVEVAMDDNLTGSVTWQEPLPPAGERTRETADLAGVKREQAFTVWLVARRESDRTIKVLKKARWSLRVDIAVDSGRPLGSRCRVHPVAVEQPQISEGRGETVPAGVLQGPGANEAQEFWWTPKTEGAGARTRLRP